MSTVQLSASVGLLEPPVPRKKPDKTGRPTVGEPMNFRAPPDLVRRVKRIADAMALEPSAVIRMILSEKIAEYERRAEQIIKDRPVEDEESQS